MSDKSQYKCRECGSQDLILRATVTWEYSTQSFDLEEIDEESRAYCKDCEEHVRWDRFQESSEKAKL
jgi:hypothetical protein